MVGAAVWHRVRVDRRAAQWRCGDCLFRVATRSVGLFIHSDDRARVTELNGYALKTGQPTTGEWRVVWPDGSVHWIAGRWQVLRNESGEPLRMLGVNIDVTESKRGEQALHAMSHALEEQRALLQSREELLRVFVKNVPTAVAMLDRDVICKSATDGVAIIRLKLLRYWGDCAKSSPKCLSAGKR